MRRVIIAAVAVAALAACGEKDGGGAPAPAAVAPAAPRKAAALGDEASVSRAMREVRDRFRDTILLMTDEAKLDASVRGLAVVVGRYLFETNAARIDALDAALTGELEASAAGRFRSAPLTAAFLDELESGDGWHDADKLSLKEVLGALREQVAGRAPSSPAGKALLVRLEEDVRALDAVQKMYDDELKKVFDRLETRGMEVTREKWGAYVEFLRQGRSARRILEENRAAIGDAAPVVAAAKPTRAAGKPGPGGIVPLDAPSIDGTELPDKTFLLTFDDGPNSRYTGRILEILDEFGVKATFFEVGRSVGKIGADGAIRLLQRSARTAQLTAAGHVLANHTFTHPMLTKLSDDEVRAELESSNRVFGEATGSAAKPVLFRPPYGAFSARVRKITDAMGLRTVMWNVDSEDWADPIPRSVANRVIGQAERQKRGVILFHDIHASAVEALPTVLETLKREGYRFDQWDGRELVPADLPAEPPAVADAAAAPRSKLYERSHAVVVGINEYASWPRLSYAVNDAKAVAELLETQFGFPAQNVRLLLDGDATREGILAALGGAMADPAQVGQGDRVIVFFAGHGATRALPSGRSLGYVIPVDADRVDYQSRAISMTELQDIDEAIPAKHVLYLMDACYGGLALVRGGAGSYAPEQYLEEVTSRRARQVLTAGGADEQVSDGGPNGHSIFTWTVLEGLRGKADLNGDSSVTATELFAYAAPVVSSLSHQTPAFGSLVGSEGGEVVFELAPREEFLSEESGQLDAEAIALNAQIDDARRKLSEKLSRNEALKSELATVQAQIAALDVRGGPAEAAPPAADDPRRASKLREQGAELFRERRYDEAVAAYAESLRREPRNALAANNLGYTYFAMGRLDDAMAWYQKTLEIDPGRAVVYFNLGDLEVQRGDEEKAIAAYRKFLEIAPDHKLAGVIRKKLAALGVPAADAAQAP